MLNPISSISNYIPPVLYKPSKYDRICLIGLITLAAFGVWWVNRRPKVVPEVSPEVQAMQLYVEKNAYLDLEHPILDLKDTSKVLCFSQTEFPDNADLKRYAAEREKFEHGTYMYNMNMELYKDKLIHLLKKSIQEKIVPEGASNHPTQTYALIQDQYFPVLNKTQ